jgi:NADH dehydrogenase
MGFGGLRAAKALAGKGVEVLVIDRRNFHLFQPLLYQVATASLEQEYIAYPARAVLRRWKGINFRLGEVTGVDFDSRIVRLADGEVSYDYLILAAGSATHYFGMKSIEEHAFELKSLDKTVALRNHILESFERASREPDPAKRHALLTFVVVGGGPAGVEFAGSLQELIRHELTKDYPGLDMSETKIVLLEARGSILPFLPEKQRDYAVRKLTEMGIEVSQNTQVSGAECDKVLLAGPPSCISGGFPQQDHGGHKLDMQLLLPRPAGPGHFEFHARGREQFYSAARGCDNCPGGLRWSFDRGDEKGLADFPQGLLF